MIFNWLTDETARLLLEGLILTIILTIITSALSLAIGLGVGALRLMQRRSWRWLAGVYVDLHRNVPALVLIIFWAFALPNLFPLELRQVLFFDNKFVAWLSAWTNLSVPYYALAAILALTLNTSAYLAELFRAGVGTIAQEHLDAARTLGASSLIIFRRILLPQGLRASFPAISTRLIHNMKNTALVAFVAVPEFFHSTQTAITQTFRALEFLLLAAVIYLVLSFLLSVCLSWIEQHLAGPKKSQTIPRAGIQYDHA